MKLTTRNFRCLADDTITIPDYGLVLLSGPSGSGKSTIIKAILYALFGVKAVKKPYSFGTNTCSVTLEFMGMKIQRTNRPNRLIVNNNSSLEDISGQAFINDQLGIDFNKFMISSYIQQKNNTSILSLAPTDQLAMIQTLAFDDRSQAQYKERLKEMLRDSSKLVTEKQAQVQFIQQTINELSDAVLPTEFPLPLAADQTVEECIQEYRQRTKEFNTTLSDYIEKKAQLNIDIQDYYRGHSELKMLKSSIQHASRLRARHDKLSSNLSQLPQDLQEKCVEYTRQIEYLQTQQKVFQLQQEYDVAKKDEEAERSARKAMLQKSLWAADPREIAEERLKGLRQFNKLRGQLKTEQDLDTLVAEYTKYLQEADHTKSRHVRQREALLLEKDLVHCPECKATLRWQDCKLVSSHQTTSVDHAIDYVTEIKKLASKISTVTENIAQYQRVLHELEQIPLVPSGVDTVQLASTLTEYISQNNQREEELRQIERESATLSPGLRNMKKMLQATQKKLVGLSAVDSNVDLEQLQESLRETQIACSRYGELNAEFTELKAELKTIREKEWEAEQLQEVLDRTFIQLMEEKLDILENQISKLKKIRARDEANTEELENYILYTKQQKEKEKWTRKLEQAQLQLGEAQEKYTARLTLKDRFRQAEIMTLESTIYSINEHTRYYLDEFFRENELSAKLSATFKDGKLHVVTCITYKGYEYDSITALSGGEFDRCTLASICGINAMQQSPVLILDESLSALDAETNTEIISFLHDLASEKLVLVCSHEAVRGIFDKVVTV